MDIRPERKERKNKDGMDPTRYSWMYLYERIDGRPKKEEILHGYREMLCVCGAPIHTHPSQLRIIDQGGKRETCC